MPARIVVVLKELGFAERVAAQLVDLSYDAIAVGDSMAALELLEAGRRIELLVTCEQFGPHRPTGLSLARMAQYHRPGTKILFIGAPELAAYAEDVGDFLASPVSEPQVVQKALAMLSSDDRQAGPE
ncbi:MAG: hypothetical protein JO047_08055 [Alphaproteobacteria bacterium]|nr:hypothetical protein [Alphaproteobacteria bacterium]